ncbi:F-box protein SKIP8 [Magnolia sinica]|uniref:F-box protein SKIP8 n=1 Tax=Magnolia sinica TaxID=86752 RepID=UPI00265AF66B|nr:F-box protein SKIP8 [Magnolia sinica]
MENSSIFPFNSSFAPFCVAAAATAFCCLCALWAVRSKKAAVGHGGRPKKSCGCSCSCGVDSHTPYANGSAGERYEKGPATMAVERPMGGGSMMEQLVPEITTHTLSYLDYPSLCRLSMTNTSMRRAANDDSAWKALYHKDFTVEQDSVTPLNGWKSYYAATKAVVNINAIFYNIINERSLSAMGRLWLHADYVKCVHGSGELFTGYNAVMDSWELAFSWGQGIAFQIRDVRVRVLSDMAWVTLKAFVDVESGPFHVTNVFEFHNGQWYMVHHHSSVMLIDGEAEHHNIFG